MNTEFFGLTASSPRDVRNVFADYLYDQGLDVASEASRLGLFEIFLVLEFGRYPCYLEHFYGCGSGDGSACMHDRHGWYGVPGSGESWGSGNGHGGGYGYGVDYYEDCHCDGKGTGYGWGKPCN